MDNNFDKKIELQEDQNNNLNIYKIEKIKTKSGKYVKYINPNTKQAMIFGQEDVKKARQTNDFIKSPDETTNIKNMINYTMKNDINKYSFINIKEVKNNLSKYLNDLENMTLERQIKFNFLIMNSEKLNIDKINLHYLIVVDNNNKVLKNAIEQSEKVAQQEGKNNMNNETNYEKMEEKNNESLDQMVIDGEIINVKLYYEYPELLEKQYQDENKRQKINEAIEMYKNKQVKQDVHKPKILEFTNNNYEKKAGFLDVILLSVIVFVFMVLMIFISIGIVGY